MKTCRAKIAALLLAAPLAAFAHVKLESSTPAKGSTIQASPGKVLLVFQEAVTLKAMSVAKQGDKAAKPLGPLPMPAEQLLVPLPKLADGAYVITYRYVGDDGHEMTGTIPFKVSATAR